MSTTNGISQDYLNGQSAAILVVFIVVSFFVIWPIRIPVLPVIQRAFLSTLRTLRIIDRDTQRSLNSRTLHFPVSLETAPVIGVLLLLATTTIDGSTITLGVKGDENVKPYDVLVLFISLAYIAIALDGTGALEAVAFWVSKRGGSSGPRLFAYLYMFFLLTGVIVGNDPLILSGTPFLAYLTKYTNFEPTAWIFSEFMAANTASAVLVSSNPTNILIAGSFQLNYLTDFTKWTILPSVVPGFLNYFVLFFMFRHQIPKKIVPLEGNPWSKLRDPKGAVYLSVLMVVTISVLVGTSFVPGHAVEVWMVTAPAGVMALAYEIVSDLVNPEKQREIVNRNELDLDIQLSNTEKPGVTDEKHTVPPASMEKHDSIINGHVSEKQDHADISQRHPSAANSTSTAIATPPQHPKDQDQDQDRIPTPPNDQQPQHQQLSSSKEPTTLLSLLRKLTHHFPRTTRTIPLLPLPLLPFAICQFILIRGLSQRGWISVFARGFLRATPNPVSSVFFYGFVSAAFLCPFAGTNIGATILLVEILRSDVILQSPEFTRDGGRVLKGAVYATALGSNLGAFSYVFAASLAGLLWKGLLLSKGIKVGQGRFCLVNFVPLVVQTAVACGIIVGQVYWFD